MSYNLWKSLIENDVDSFRQHVARANYNNATKTVSGFHVGSPGTLGTSPKTPKARRGGHIGSAGKSSGVHWTKAEINARDRQGLTILHHAASSRNENALEFVKILLGSSQLDLYIQDAENGWTALHRALYFGNVDIAQALMLRDLQNATDYAASTVHAQAGGLIKIKDHEGNSPFEVFGYTIAPRILQSTDPAGLDIGGDDDSVNGVDVRDETVNTRAARLVQPRVDLQGDEFYAFGSNKNLTLGLGDGDDRQFPERIHLQRPDYLLRRLHEDYVFESKESTSTDPNNSVQTLPMPSALPAIIQNEPIIIQEVIMSKLHTAILTKDPISNLHVTGFGPGGRLGAGDEITRFNFVCIQGALAKRRVSTIALGQDHTIAICSSGEVFTWGNAQDGKLGYTLPEISPKEVPVQLVPRQLYGLVKKEQIVGAAASAIHSIIFTPTALFAFGRNAGQLGLVDADARSLEVQVIPRRVGTSILQSPIQSVAAIDRATTVLLENHDVIVFTHYAYKKIIFPFEEAPELYSNTALRTVYDKEPNSIVKVTNGGNTICAVSSFGQVFTIDVPKEADHVPANVSTTNPNKARNALPQPSRVWSIGKSHMAAIDAAVGQDGSIILCTTSGAVWRKEKRANIKSIHEKPADTANVKDYKFVRVSNITRAIAVRSNAKGAFGVVRKDCEVTRDQITEDPPSLKDAIFPLLAFHDYGTTEDENSTEPQLRFWVSHKKKASPDLIKHAVLTGKTVEDDFLTMFKRFEPLSASGYDVWITSNVTDIRIPVHSFLLRARSHALHTAFLTFLDTYYVEISDAVALEYGQDGQIHIKFKGADFLTLINLVLYLYSDNVVDVWHYTSRALQLAPRYRQIRVEVMKIAAVLGLEGLERSARVMVEPVQSIMRDMENAWVDTNFFDDADVIIDLASDAQMPAHSVLLRARCPFFEALFHGHAGGGWMSSRRNEVDGIAEPIRVDLKHFEERTFEMVLRYIYADTSEEMFDDVESNDLDEFLDLVIDVLSIANELMLDRLAQICQKVVGKFVTMRNVCGLLNTIAECSVTDFKTVALEYICLNLEGMLAQRLLEELDEYLVEELVEVVRENQLAYMPIARSDRVEAELLDRHPELAEDIDKSRQSRIDSMRLSTRFVDDERWVPKSRRPGIDEDVKRTKGDQFLTPTKSKAVDEDFPFTMDEDGSSHSPMPPSVDNSPSIRPIASEQNLSVRGQSLSLPPNSVDTDASNLATPLQPAVGSPDVTVSGFELPKAWTASTSSNSKTDFKSIMEQTSSSRVSNLSQAINAAAVGPSKSVPKMSQSQRKKQAQEMKKQEVVIKESETKSSPSPSPWIKTTPIVTRSITSPLIEAGPPTIPSPAPARPTIVSPQTSSKGPVNTKVASTRNTPGTTRTVSSPALGESPKPIVPQIQSVRHIPLTNRSRSFVDSHTSMAEILAQEQADKMAIKEAAAKRSLQEIQQEQEFEAWWSAESKRVQEEEAQAQAVASNQRESNRKSSRGRGNRKRGSARGAASVSVASPAEEQIQPAKSEPSTATIPDQTESGRGRNPGRSRGRGTGNGRGRGRGKIQAT